MSFPFRDRTLAIGFAAVLASALLAGPAAAQLSEDQKPYWQGRYRAVLDDYERAKATYRLAEEEYRQAAHANRIGAGSRRSRGVEREQIKLAVPEAAARMAEAKQALELFPDKARHAGVPPGWLREVDEQREDAKLEAERDAQIYTSDGGGWKANTPDSYPAVPSDDTGPPDPDDVMAPADQP